MTTMSEEDMLAYLKKAADRCAAQLAVADTEVGVVKELKRVSSKSTPRAEELDAVSPQATSGRKRKSETANPKPPITRRQRKAASEEPTEPKKATTTSEVVTEPKKIKCSEEAVSWYDVLTEFTGEEEEPSSLWGKRFPIGHFVFDELVADDDIGRVENIGPEQSFLALQSFGLKAASIGRICAAKFNKLKAQDEKNREALNIAKKSLEKQPNLADEVARLQKQLAEQPDLTAEVAKLKGDLASQEAKHLEREEALKKSYDETIATWSQQLTDARSQLEDKATLLVQKDSIVENLKLESADYMLTGFFRAKDQLKVLYPTMDFSGLDVMKEVMAGKLVNRAALRVEEEPKEVSATTNQPDLDSST